MTRRCDVGHYVDGAEGISFGPLNERSDDEKKQINGHDGWGALIASLMVAGAASATANDDTLVWPYGGSSSQTYTTQEDASSMREIMEAFGADPEDAAALEGVDLSKVGPDSPLVPAALTEADPVRTERGSNESLTAEVQVYSDGSLALTVAQTDTIAATDSTIIQFESATIDFVQVSEALNLQNSQFVVSGGSAATVPADASPLDVPTGCTALPNSGGWIRRADCYVYDSVHAPPLNGVAASAYFDYSVKSASGRMDSIRRNDSHCAGGFSSSQAYVDRQYNSGSLPARGLHEVDCNWGVFSSTHIQQVLVLGTAWSSMS